MCKVVVTQQIVQCLVKVEFTAIFFFKTTKSAADHESSSGDDNDYSDGDDDIATDDDQESAEHTDDHNDTVESDESSSIDHKCVSKQYKFCQFIPVNYVASR